KGLRGLDPLKQLFWTELNYQRVNQPLSRRGWSETAADALADDPLLFAAGGQGDAFEIIYARLKSDKLLLGLERPAISRLLRDHPFALFAVSNTAQQQWHFINVKYDEDDSKRRQFRRITIGKDERLRTAAERLEMLDLAGLTDLSPLGIQQTHDDAFDVEAVQKNFFKAFADLYDNVATDIAKVPEVEGEAGRIAQLLLDRMLFLYFIQKKDWLDKKPDYLYSRFAACWHKDPKGASYYHSVLLPLFRCLSDSNADRNGVGDVPFLNGGLFEENAKQPSTELLRLARVNVKNSTFKAIFEDLLEKFNFTVTEDTPLDVEVAIDPEMLGKIFESLILQLEKDPEKDLRRLTGSYYTPRPIVHFMCQEALKEYLVGELTDEDDDAADAARVKIGELLSLPPADHLDDGQIRRLNELFSPAEAKSLRQSILDCRVCDPAVGSGAFPVGMMHEMVAMAGRLDARLHGRNVLRQRNYDYDLKKQIVEACLYGADIQEQAVRLCELRLWLSLVVDYQIDATKPFSQAIRDVPNLPNLSYRIVRGDSLLERLFGHVVQLDEMAKDAKSKQLIDSIQSDKHTYFREGGTQEKRRLELKILAKQADLAERLIDAKRAALTMCQKNLFGDEAMTAKERRAREQRDCRVAELADLKDKVTRAREHLDRLAKQKAPVDGGNPETLRRQLFRTGDAPTFMWRVDFAEVFREKGGFDIVVGNPPYINMIQMDKVEGLRDLFRSRYLTAQGAFDVFVPFYELSYQIARQAGVVSLITPNKILSAEYATALRAFFSQRTAIVHFLDASDCRPFEAAVYPVTMLIVRKPGNPDDGLDVYKATRSGSQLCIERRARCSTHLLQSFSDGIWSPILESGIDVIAQAISADSRFEDVCTIRQAASVDEAYKVFKPLLCEEPRAKGVSHKRFLISGTIDRYKNLWGTRDTFYLKTRFKKPVLKLDESALSSERLHQIRSPKIIVSGQALYPKAFLDQTGSFASGIPTVLLYDSQVPLEYLCGLLNSALYRAIYRVCWGTLAMSGGYMRFGPPQIKRLPLPEASDRSIKTIVTQVRRLMEVSEVPNHDAKLKASLEQEIDQAVLALFVIDNAAFVSAFPRECASQFDSEPQPRARRQREPTSPE
ncbi:MAG: Eco57I restriction-modification methylase domain-containing protein, partial [Thermoguttaceae bacterium]